VDSARIAYASAARTYFNIVSRRHVVSTGLAEILASERKKRGLNYTQFAALVGCSDKAIAFWETGQRNISDIDLLDRMLKTLGLTVTIGADDGETR